MCRECTEFTIYTLTHTYIYHFITRQTGTHSSTSRCVDTGGKPDRGHSVVGTDLADRPPFLWFSVYFRFNLKYTVKTPTGRKPCLPCSIFLFRSQFCLVSMTFQSGFACFSLVLNCLKVFSFC